jgi:DNA ligase-1
MIKDMESPYECKRNTFWLKYNPVLTVDLKEVAVEAGTGRNSSRMGALVCEGFEGDKFIQVNVGSGFSDEQRDEIWTNQEVVLNQTVEVLCDVITQNQDGTYSLRFPRFVRFRTDK